jgi:hypothetical protein
VNHPNPLLRVHGLKRAKKKNLFMKEGSLFCFVGMRSIEQGWMLEIVFFISLESSRRRRGGVHGLGSMMFGLAVQKFLNIE